MSKLDRFLDTFEAQNNNPKLAEFLNEVITDLEGEEKYIEHLETDIMQRHFQHRNLIRLLNRTHKTILMAKRTLIQVRRMA